MLLCKKAGLCYAKASVGETDQTTTRKKPIVWVLMLTVYILLEILGKN